MRRLVVLIGLTAVSAASCRVAPPALTSSAAEPTGLRGDQALAVHDTLPTTATPTDAARTPDTKATTSATSTTTTMATTTTSTTTTSTTTATAPDTSLPPRTMPTTTVSPTTAMPPGPVIRSGQNVTADVRVGEPVGISIPAIGVESDVVPTGTLPDGSVDVPADPGIAGWFEHGPRPGARGPAVIMGHVDSRSYGPGVFYRLRDLPVGSLVTVRTNGGPIDFEVESVRRFPKNEFPTELVYGPVPTTALRLITCGGSFDRSTGHYRDNVVAFLTPVTA